MKLIQRRIERAILIVCCVTCLFVRMQPMYLIAAENSNHITENPDWADSPSIMGESGIVMEVSTGSILYEKNMHDIHYPASITKIMTALLAVYQDTLELLNYSLDSFSKVKINEDKAYFEEILKKENQIIENCFIGYLFYFQRLSTQHRKTEVSK